MSLTDGNCVVVKCRGVATVGVMLGPYDATPACFVCEDHARALGGLWRSHGDIEGALVSPDKYRAKGWRLVTSLVNSQERVVLYPPGTTVPDE